MPPASAGARVSKRVRVHQRLGYAGIGLGAAILPIGFMAAVRAAKYGSSSTPPGVNQLGFMIVPLTDLVMFVIFSAPPSTIERSRLSTRC